MPRSVPTERARQLRAQTTRAEAYLWGALRNRRLGGWKWRRQVCIGPFVVDFLCVETKLVVEVDGASHTEQEAYDAWRTKELEARGFRVIRFWNDGVFKGREGVCDAILAGCGGPRSNAPLCGAPPHPTLSP
jgi:very-short-patch-repair endonuclease